MKNIVLKCKQCGRVENIDDTNGLLSSLDISFKQAMAWRAKYVCTSCSCPQFQKDYESKLRELLSIK